MTSPKDGLEQMKAGTMSRRDFMGLAASLGLTAAAVNACPAAAAAPSRGGTVRLATDYSGGEETFDLTRMNNATDAQRSYQVYNRLCNLDRNMRLVPNLATSWESKPGAREWIFVLREGVEFHNGKTLTAEDVVYSISEHIKPNSKSPAKPYLQNISSVKADGNYRVKIELASGSADLPYVFGHDFHTGVIPSGWKNGDPVVGTGPYQLVEFTPGGRSVVKRFPNYWKPDSAWVESFVTQGIADTTARSAALRAGDMDIVMALDPKLVSLMAADPKVRVAEIASGSHMTFAMLCDAAPTNDINVRLALKHAFHRQAMLKTVLLNHGQVGNDIPVSPAIPTYAHDIPQHDFDADKAAYHWRKAGIGSIELVVSKAVGGGEEAGLVLQAHAKTCGIDLRIRRAAADGYFNDTWMKVPFCVSSWNARPTADLILTLGYQSQAPWNETHWSNPRFDRLLAEGRVELDEARRKAIYREAQLLLHDEGGVIVPFFNNYIDATSSRIQNFRPSPAFQLSAGWMYEEIWVAGS
jgi:peptide/nickel transport system substrate-binding protein